MEEDRQWDLGTDRQTEDRQVVEPETGVGCWVVVVGEGLGGQV